MTFGASAASLKLAVEISGRNEDVCFLADDLSIGPINPADPKLRHGADDENDAADDIAHDEAFWSRIANHCAEIVAWISRRSASELCGLHELLWRVEDTRISVVDVADVGFARPDGTPSPHSSTAFALVHERDIVAKNLFDRAALISAAQREVFRRDWQRLRNENGALRVLTETGLISAPITHFDELIISFVTSESQRCARIVGDAHHAINTGPFYQGGGDVFVFERLLALMDTGVLEGKNSSENELWSMSESWV